MKQSIIILLIVKTMLKHITDRLFAKSTTSYNIVDLVKTTDGKSFL